MKDCIFCDIVQGKARANIVLETENHVVFENIDPQAPVHVLVVTKKHIPKEDSISGKIPGLWDDTMSVVNQVIKKYGLDKTGYRLSINGAGYHGVNHEHIHVLGGKNWKPKDNL